MTAPRGPLILDKILLIDTFLYISFYWYSRVSLVSHAVSSSDAVPCAFHMMFFYLNQLHKTKPNASLVTL